MAPNVDGSVGVTWTRSVTQHAAQAERAGEAERQPETELHRPRFRTSHDTCRRCGAKRHAHADLRASAA